MPLPVLVDKAMVLVSAVDQSLWAWLFRQLVLAELMLVLLLVYF